MRRLLLAATVVVGAVVLAVVPLASAVPPGVTIDSAPADPTTATTANFSFSSPDTAATFDCDLDGSVVPLCTSPKAYSGLADGTHTFTVIATNLDPGTSSASFTWTVDTTAPPVPTITSGPTGTTNDASPAFAFNSSGATSFRCSIDDAAPTGNCDGGTFTASALADGAHTFYVTAADSLGNTSGAASRAFTVDNTPPPVPTITSGPTGTTNDVTPAFAFNSSGATSFKCSIDDATPSIACNGGSFTPSPALGSGGHTFYVTAADSVGNTSAAASQGFTVDTVPPDTTISPAVPATIASTNVSIAFSSADGTATFACKLDSGSFNPCTSPASLVGLADGSHTFAVQATDAAGNVDASPATASWIIDTTPPALTGPGSLGVEADGGAGTKVAFSVTGSDGGLALLPGVITCAPVSNTRFPLGQSTVTCTSQDSAGNTGTLAFDITVRDTTPPSINAPDASLTATDTAGIARTDPAIASYLAGISASDLVSTPTVTTTTPEQLPIGITKIVVTARDAAGNQAQRTVTLTILEPGKKAPTPDFTPPGPVRNPKAAAGDRKIVLTWVNPTAADLEVVRITRTAVGSTAETTVYSSLKPAFTSRGLKNGVAYRFVIVALDKAGNSSSPVVVTATPVAPLLASPRPGARVAKPPLLRWATVPATTYYNVQLYRGGKKILSAWPAVTRLQLKAKWTYDNRKYVLKPGIYTWYAWPGVGPRSAAVYGPLLGKSQFLVTVPRV
ncbi:MAG: Ig-like domain-containing protein [Thermoleophilia bacterium]|nr:Ig-like domain-containing protein [Thermoleophilia bacterium]